MWAHAYIDSSQIRKTVNKKKAEAANLFKHLTAVHWFWAVIGPRERRGAELTVQPTSQAGSQAVRRNSTTGSQVRK